MAGEILSVSEVAARWRVSTTTIHRMIERGSLDAFALDPESNRVIYRIRLEEVERIEAARYA